MQRRLVIELKDEGLTKRMNSYLLDIGFHWSPPSRPAAKIESIVAYSFGNRLPAAGSKQILPDPGPVNEELANAAWLLHQKSHAPVYAQWEIARFLKEKHGLEDVVSIEPVVAKDGTITYLSTDGVAEAVVTHKGGNAASLGVVGVIGHKDHVKRCVLTSRARGMNAYVADGVELPVAYDPQSGQSWTRQRELYLIHDMAAQFMMLRGERIAQEYPHG